MQTISFNFEHNYDSGPDVHIALVPIRLFALDGTPLAFRAILDTGASFSIFDKAIAGLVGIDDILSGQPRQIQTADDTMAEAYVHNVKLEVLGQQMTIPIGFVPTWDEGIENLLGMDGFFDRISAAFIHQERRFLVTFL